MLPVVLPVSLVSLLVGAGLATGRRGLTMLKTSPVPGILIVKWVRFTSLMARHPKNYSSPRGHYGMFGTDMRSLVDVGFADDPCKIVVGAETGVWDAKFRAPLTKTKFLASGPAQYEAFRRKTVHLLPSAAPHVGSTVDGVKCTLSGLLGVGHYSGAAGIQSWVQSPTVRKKFEKTTAAFHLTNGVF